MSHCPDCADLERREAEVRKLLDEIRDWSDWFAVAQVTRRLVDLLSAPATPALDAEDLAIAREQLERPDVKAAIAKLEPPAAVEPAPAAPAAKCAYCANNATCIGVYERSDDPPAPACDDCCGHGCEDGKCYPIDEPNPWDWDGAGQAPAEGHNG